ncbi:RES family NAD+ phosphorylase [Roseomonas sp. E05]|uniref:RES family NAD+ phosphorylase n=1 Tax=Roseomonas sp. E05 TaxID=3046310 RepID=UPI0024B89E26|nr:RES family NAD+ phosphorylase [Roseomonas sp. E05]MDJ0389624.1 RES family NAD+ phosphorylase [Roseomonas sp. E05]
MSLEGPGKPEFAHWDDYRRFARHLRSTSRYVWGEKERAFLRTVLGTIRNRDTELKQGQILYRAQRGVEWIDRTDEEGNSIGAEVSGFGPSRMKPLTDRAREGRANPTGIPVLYVASSVETAISEVRPWVGTEISVAVCRVLRPLRALDLSKGHGQSSLKGAVLRHLTGGEAPTAEEKEKAVWIEIDNAFSWPVTLSDDRADYAPTQVLAELFRSVGYEAIIYKSHFGDEGDNKGYNLAIFDPDAVEIVSCAPYEVKSIKVEARPI